MIDNPTRQSFVSELVPSDDLANAVGLNSAIITAARTAGPAAAGIPHLHGRRRHLLPPERGLVIAVIGALRRMDPDALYRGDPVARQKGQLREGFRYVWSTPVLRSTLLLMAVVGTLAFNFRMFVPLLAEKVFAGGPGTFGALSAMMGLGTIAGALASAASRRPTRKLLLASALAFGALLAAVAYAPSLALAMAVIVPMGAASIVFAATANSTLQMESAPAMRGRVMALYGVVFLGSTPVGGPLMGLVAEVLGVRHSMALAGAATVLAAVFALRARIRREAVGAFRRASGVLATRVDAARPGSRKADGGRRSAPHPVEQRLRTTRRSGEAPSPRRDRRSSSSSRSPRR